MDKNYIIGFDTALVIILVILKVSKVINWNWLWVFGPWWVPFFLIIIILGSLKVSNWIKYEKIRSKMCKK